MKPPVDAPMSAAMSLAGLIWNFSQANWSFWAPRLTYFSDWRISIVLSGSVRDAGFGWIWPFTLTAFCKIKSRARERVGQIFFSNSN